MSPGQRRRKSSTAASTWGRPWQVSSPLTQASSSLPAGQGPDSKIQVWASVNEADIGRIVPGVPVSFTVDAYPNETFKGEVAQVRLNATMTQNVVTYTVVVTTENKKVETPPDKSTTGGEAINTGPRYKLLPYMTANLLFEIERHEDVLKVPNAALRWKPRPQQIAPDVREETLKAMAGGGGKSKKNPVTARRDRSGSRQPKTAPKTRRPPTATRRPRTARSRPRAAMRRTRHNWRVPPARRRA